MKEMEERKKANQYFVYVNSEKPLKWTEHNPLSTIQV